VRAPYAVPWPTSLVGRAVGEARALFEQSLAIHRELGNRPSECITLGNLAGLVRVQGRMEEASALFRQAIITAREIGDRRSEGIGLSNLATVSLEQDRVDEARTLLQQALVIAREVAARNLETCVLGSLGHLHWDQGRLDEAGVMFAQTLEIAREVGERHYEGITLLCLASHARWQGHLDEAATLVKQSEASAHELGNKVDLANRMLEHGHILLAQGQGTQEPLATATAFAHELAVTPDSELAKNLAATERAQAAFEDGKPLVCGYYPEDVPEGIMRWLREHRPEAIPPSVLPRLAADGTLRPEEAGASSASPTTTGER